MRLIQGLRRAQTDTERRERLLEAILTEDEADLIISLRRERDENLFLGSRSGPNCSAT